MMKSNQSVEEKKILHVVSVFFSIPFFLGDQLGHFGKKNYEVHVICSPSEKLADYSKRLSFRYKQVPVLRKISLLKDLWAVCCIFRYIKSNRLGVVCGHTAKGSLVSMIAAFLAGVPKRIYFRHGIYYETSVGLKRWIMLNIDRVTSWFSTVVVCVSPYVIERSLKDRLTARDKMILLNRGSCNGVDDIDKFNPSKISKSRESGLRSKLGICSSSFVIGYTGRLVRDKGIVELVDGYQILKGDIANLKLLLVGPLEERDSLPDYTLDLIKNDPNIISTGMIDDDIQYYYSLMNVLVLPTYRDGFGTSILEASSMAIPVLTTAHSGSRDAIVDGETGVYIELTRNSIAEAIKVYVSNGELRRLHGSNGRKFVKMYFSQSIIWNEIESKLYKK